jgi:S-DNA-T family DNA segregation ATPase FtsK/SpoIIIE
MFNNFMVALYLLLFATMISVSLLSHNPGDPSFNLATDQAPRNMAGPIGAIISDLLFVSFGVVSAALIAIIPANWAIIILKKKRLNWWFLRLVVAIISLLTMSATATAFADYLNLTINGGILGSFLIEVAEKNGIPYAGILCGITSIVTLALSLGYNFSEYYNLLGILANLGRKLINAINHLVKAIIGGVSSVVEQASARLSKNPIRQEPQVNIKPIEKSTPKIAEAYQLELDTALDTRLDPYVQAAVQAANKPIPTQAAPVKAFKPYIHGFELPPIDLFNKTPNTVNKQETPDQLKKNAAELLAVLNDFGIKGNILEINQGPVVTLYEFEPSAGTKSSRVIGLSDDIARTLSAVSTRIAVIPGRNVLGIELPNKHRALFYLKELIETREYNQGEHKLPIILGKDLGGKPYIADLARMPHLLVAGTTGSGKSVAINVMILSLLYRHSPDNCKFIMIDPKMLELSVYDGIPHLLTPVVTEPGKAVVALKWAVKEMENRYRLMSNLGVRNIDGYNAKIMDAIKSNQKLERTIQTGFDSETGRPIYEAVPIPLEKLPFIVIIVDEMADLMLVAGKDIESSIQRLAQMARAAGIHLIMATQRPSVDVITGVIKANFPSRISFKVTSKIDSRTILGEQGAEQLLGMGDMLYMGSASSITRVHCPFVTDEEVERISSYLKSQGAPSYVMAVTESSDDDGDALPDYTGEEGNEADLYRQAVLIVKRDRKISTSYIQRVLRIGYNRAANLVERMEKEGVVSSANHAGKREILVPED